MLATGLGFRPALVPRGASAGIRGAGCQPLRKLGLRHAAAAAAPPPAPTPSTLPDSHGPPLGSAAQEKLSGFDPNTRLPSVFSNDLAGWCGGLSIIGLPLVVGIYGCFFAGIPGCDVPLMIGLFNLFAVLLIESLRWL